MARRGLEVPRPDSGSPVHARVYIRVCAMAYRAGADGTVDTCPACEVEV